MTNPTATKPSLHWEFIEDELSSSKQTQWLDLIKQCDAVSASSHYYFAVNSAKLINAQNIIYAMAYHNEELVTACVLLRKTKSLCGLRFRLLQTINHDHLDFYMLPNQLALPAEQLIQSLLEALQQDVTHWDFFSGRRWFFPKRPAVKSISPTYSRVAAYFDLSGVSELGEVVSKKILKNMRRHEKKIVEKAGPLELVTIHESQLMEEALQTFVSMEAKGWKGEAGSAIDCSQALNQFYRATWQEMSNQNSARIYLLRQTGKVLASAIGFQHGRTIYLHKITYDETLAEFSPGSLLVKHIAEQAIIEGGYQEVCFNTNPPWIKRWHPKFHSLFAVLGFNSNLKGRIAAGIFYLSDQLKLQKRKLNARQTKT